MNKSDSPLTFTVDETAKLLGIGRNNAYEAVRRGEIPAIRIGKRLLIPRSGLAKLLGTEPLAAGEFSKAP